MSASNAKEDSSRDEFTVLGASGFIGSNILHRLRENKQHVRTPTKVDSDFFKNRHGHIIYCIGMTADFRRRQLDTMEAHVCVLRNLLESAEFESLTYLSSTRVYHGASRTTEDAALTVNPIKLDDLYGISKLAGESLCLHSGRKNVKVARLSNIVGLRHDCDLFIDELLSEIVVHNTLTLKSSIESTKDYLYIDDAVDAILSLAISAESGCFNVASGENVSNQVIIEHLKSNFDFQLNTSELSPVLEFPRIDTRKIRNILGFSPKKFADYFPQYINLYKENKGIK